MQPSFLEYAAILEHWCLVIAAFHGKTLHARFITGASASSRSGLRICSPSFSLLLSTAEAALFRALLFEQCGRHTVACKALNYMSASFSAILVLPYRFFYVASFSVASLLV